MDFKIFKRDFWGLLLIIGLAIFFRLWYLFDFVKTEAYPVYCCSDCIDHVNWAINIANGDIVGRHVFMKWPLYAYFLGFLLKFSAFSLNFLYIVQFILGVLNCFLVYLIGKIIFNKWVGLFAGFCYVWYGIFIFYESLFLYTTLSIFMNLLFFLFVFYIRQTLSLKKLFLLGIYLGMCALAQANIILFGFFSVIWLLSSRKLHSKAAYLGLISFLAGLSIVLGIVSARNYFVEKDFSVLTAHGGFNFYLGNNPQSDGTFDFSVPVSFSSSEGFFRDANVIADLSSGRKLKASEASNFWVRKVFIFIVRQPVAFLNLTARKIACIFSPREFFHDPEFGLILHKITVFKFLFLDLRFIFPFAFIGMIFGLRYLKNTTLLYLATMSFSISLVFFFVTTRYRMALVPFIAVFAGFGLYYFIDTLHKKRFFRFTGSFILLFITLFISYNLAQKSIPSSRQESEFWVHFGRSGTYLVLDQYKKALDEISYCRRMQPGNPQVLYQAGNIYFYMNDLENAEKYLKDTIVACKTYIDAYYKLGRTYNITGRFDKAVDILEQAVSLSSDDMKLHFELGKAYKGCGNYIRARNEFLLVLRNNQKADVKQKDEIEREISSMP